ncbi:MAG: PKD repeat protein [Crocinitomicaceae bacterium]|jgi:PKD repeat protein
MKQALLILGLLCFGLNSFAQTFDSKFLDGTIMFQLNDEPTTIANLVRSRDTRETGLPVNINDYPELAKVFSGITITDFEKPSYFTGKPALMKIFRIEFAEFAKIDWLIRELEKIGSVTFAEKEPIYTFDFVPNDTFHTGNNKWYHDLVGSENAWNISTGSSTVKIAIVDNAVFGGHSDLTTFLERDVADGDNDATPPDDVNVDFGWSHGTHCAGLATADINNATGIASIGGNVQLIAIKTTPDNATSSGSIWYGYSGVQWACQNGANVVSMSYGSASSSAAMQTLIDSYPGVVFMAAAGNDGNTTLQYPGAYNNVICVGSVNSTDLKSSFSNYNGGTPFVDIAAPGGYSFGGLLSSVYTAGGNNYAQMGGTSMATPFAAGLVGLMLSINPTMTPAAVEACMISTGVNINQNIGPRIDALAAIQCVQSTLNGDPIPYFSGTPLSIVEGDNVAFTDLSVDGGNAITNWTWTFTGGTPNTFIGQNPPAIQYNTAGSYDVSLSVTNSQNTVVTSEVAYVNVTIAPYGDWIEQVSGFTTASVGINYISIVDPNVVWATGYDGSGGAANLQTFTKTTDGGLNWTPGTIDVQDAGLGISMLSGANSTTAWLAAYPTAGGQTGGVWKTTNGGTSWTRQNTATFNNAASFTNVVHFWDANSGFCQGDPISGDFELYTTTNGGTTWTQVPGGNIPNPTNGNEFGYTRQIDVIGDNVWFSTSLGRIYHSADKGLTWNVFNTPVADFGGAVTAGTSANFSFSSATDGLIVDNAGTVYRTTNGGTSWTTVTTTGSVYTNGLCFIEGTNTAFTTGAGAGVSGSSYSTDGGTTWNIIDTEQHLYCELSTPSIGWSGWFNVDNTTAGMWKWNDLSSSLVADFSGTNTTTCSTSPVIFADLTIGGTPTTWLWSFPGGTPTTSILPNPSVTYSTPGTYDVTLTVGDGNSQTTYTQTAFVTSIAPATVPSAITGALALCETDVETYVVTNDPNVVYNWTIPASWTGTSTTNSITVTAGAAGGNVEVNAENICGSSANSSVAVIIGVGSPTAGFTQSNVVYDYTFTSTSTNAGTWSWDFGDGIGTSNLESPTYTYTTNGTFTVTLIVDNGCGTDTYTESVTITGVGLDEHNLNLISVYPNPAENLLNVLVSQDMIGESYEVKDVSGKVIYTGMITQELTTIELNTISSGIYFVSVGETSSAQKFVKE